MCKMLTLLEFVKDTFSTTRCLHCVYMWLSLKQVLTQLKHHLYMINTHFNTSYNHSKTIVKSFECDKKSI
jgi:hypothetical protein